MRLLLMLLSFSVFACTDKPAPVTLKDSPSVQKIAFDSMVVINVDTTSYCNYLKMENDSLKTALFQSQFKVNKVKYYLKICLKNPSQDKFLKGWIKRAVQ